VVLVMVASCQTAKVFADMLCSDPEWVDSEFEAIVSGLLIAPSAASAPSLAPFRPSKSPQWDERKLTQCAADADARNTRSRIRSPPLARAGSAGA
jgi:hypothetical protein